MPHEKTRNSLLPDSCKLDQKRALTISPGIQRQTDSPLKIPRRLSAVDDERVETEMFKEPKKSPSKIHWTQLATNGTSSQSNPNSQKNSTQENAIWQEIRRRQVKVVLENVLQTEIGQSLLRCSRQSFQKTNQSESKRQSDRNSTAILQDKRRTSITKRGATDSIEPKVVSPSYTLTEAQSKQLSSSEVLSNSFSTRENDLPQAVQISEKLTKQPKPFSLNEATLLVGSPQLEEELSSGYESVRCSSPLASQSRLREEKSGDKDLPNKKERRESQGDLKDALENKKNHLHRNGEVLQEVEGMRGSVLRLSVGADGQIPVKRSRLDSLSGEDVPNLDVSSGGTEGQSFIVEPTELNMSETIVLSSEEEEEGDEREEKKPSTINIQPPEGAINMNIEDKSVYQLETPEYHSHTTGMYEQNLAGVQLQLSSLHMGGVSATSNDKITISTDKITFSLKDSSLSISLSKASVLKYSLWEEVSLRGCGLVKDNEVPPPALLFFWLSDALAHRLHNELSVIESGTRPEEGSRCLLLCLAESVSGIESALLASVMDLVASPQDSHELSYPLSQSESLKLLESSQETHLLQLLTPKTDAQTITAAVSAEESQDSDVQPVYTLCHRRVQGSYSVSMARTPGPEWTPYRHCGPTRRLIQFPPPPSKGAITVTTEDLECLDSGEFLNDVIIDFYLKYLLVKKAPQQSVDRSHVFSSFFYKQLTRRDNANEDSTSTPAQVRRHQRVRTWTRHVDIFKKDFLFVPVNQEAHWYLVVICYPGLEEPQYWSRDGRGSVQADGGEGLGEGEGEMQGENSSFDEDKNTDGSHIKSSTSCHLPSCTENTCKRNLVCKRPCILIMDSLKLSVHERIFKLLREYLQVEWEAKRKGYRDFNADYMVGSHCKVPLQDNSSDCGLYLLQYAESFLQDPVVHFDLPLRLECWFPRQQVRGKRDEIRDLILHLHRFQQSSLGNEALEDRTDHENVIQ